MSRCEYALQKDCRGTRLMRWEHWKVQTAPVSQSRAMSAAAPLALFAPRWLKGCSMDTSTESGCKGIHLPPASILGPCTLCLFLREVDSFLDPQPSFPCSCLSVIPGSGVWVWPWHPSSVSVLSHPSVTHHSGDPCDIFLGDLTPRPIQKWGFVL